jgi:hypothetical protein
MPFTPFHLGFGLLAKAALPGRMSLTSFTLTQFCIDVETLYHLSRSEWPAHRQLHSVVGGCAVGLLVAGGLLLTRRIAQHVGRVTLGEDVARSPLVSAETSGMGTLLGGLLGGASHSMLDAIMHSDVRPLWPLAGGNPLLGLVAPWTLHASCVLAGLVGLALLWAGLRRAPAT